MKTSKSFCILSLVLMLSLGAAGSAGAHEDHKKGTFTKHFNGSLFDITGNEAFSVEVLPDDREYDIGKEKVGIVVHNADDEDVTGAELTIVHRDVRTGERAPGRIIVTDKGNGLYVVSGLDIKRDGPWELAITVSKKGVSGEVKFALPDALRKPLPKGRYAP